ncbi:MAG: hypothetical protein D3906_16880, partial [Candidatus Electrothrix sp. AUS1_2]|nr:hypothetical protein [Candidatus Electrothrix sp. AUS1_2]
MPFHHRCLKRIKNRMKNEHYAIVIGLNDYPESGLPPSHSKGIKIAHAGSTRPFLYGRILRLFHIMIGIDRAAAIHQKNDFVKDRMTLQPIHIIRDSHMPGKHSLRIGGVQRGGTHVAGVSEAVPGRKDVEP